MVAIFCAGPEWQFKGWPWYQQGGIVSVFSKGELFPPGFFPSNAGVEAAYLELTNTSGTAP